MSMIDEAIERMRATALGQGLSDDALRLLADAALGDPSDALAHGVRPEVKAVTLASADTFVAQARDLVRDLQDTLTRHEPHVLLANALGRLAVAGQAIRQLRHQKRDPGDDAP
jgi:hypothetical protein